LFKLSLGIKIDSMIANPNPIDIKSLRIQFGIVQMPFFVPFSFFYKVLLKSFGEINPTLIRQTQQYPKHIGHFIG